MTNSRNDDPSADSGAATATNRLRDESSAYLRQHMHNPVDWHPWGPEALALAEQTNRPLLVSIGYSACHWCHVMAHESFEDEATAALMNEHFVNIKVDREERPDIDQIFMDTVVRLTGHGGWPLTVFCLPDGKPFYAGTYFPSPDSPNRQGHASFHDVLTAVSDAYHNRRDEVDSTSAQILEALAARPQGESDEVPGARFLVAAAWALMEQADRNSGGFGEGAKFPTPTNLEALIAACDYVEPENAQDMFRHALLTAQVMSRSGLYDHLGGGFHRYCVDRQWIIPHFEKMLYDQGLLLRFYAEMWRRTGGSDDLAWPMRETAAYLRRELTGEEGAAGGFFASQDADSEGEEGRFFVWTPAQLQEVLGDDAAAFGESYGVTEAGNFEGGTTHLVDRAGAPREKHANERQTLYAARAKRVAPATDTKRVAAWNGYAISGLIRAGDLLRDDAMRQDAIAAADFCWDRMRDAGGRLLRIHDGERAKVPAFLDDHAALLDANLDLARAGAGDRFLERAVTLGEAILERFYDPKEEDLFLTPEDGDPLPHRPRSDHDGATPHASGLATLGLVRLGELTGRHEFGNAAARVLHAHALFLDSGPHAFPTLLRAAALAERGMGVAVVVGPAGDPATEALAIRARRELLPEDGVIVAHPGVVPAGVAAHWLEGRGLVDGKPAVYLCRKRACSLPITDPNSLSLTELPPPAL